MTTISAEREEATKEFVAALVSEAPCAQVVLDKHTRNNDELLFWVFMGDICIWVVERLVLRQEGVENAEIDCIEKILVILDQRLALGTEDDVENAISVSFAEFVHSHVVGSVERNPSLKTEAVLYEKIKQILPSTLKREVEYYEKC